jgi:hypothetical protein
MYRFVCAALALLALAPGVRTQQEGSLESLTLRVVSVGPARKVVVDRGSSDLVEAGDRVILRPKDGSTQRGRVVRVDDRSAVVELHDRSYVPEPGTKGEVLIPSTRRPAPEPESEAETGVAVDPDEPQQVETPPAHPVWEREDEWRAGMPLLADVRPVRPEQRAPSVSGRTFFSADTTLTTESDRSDAFVRAGGDALYENLFGKGGALHVDGELNWRTTNVPDSSDDKDANLRVDRLSYARGGTRFAPTRWEAGRFLQAGMPEFGVIDGLEWNRRKRSGDRYGVSAGFMPEPDPDFNSWQDFQVAAFYSWSVDQNERFTIDGGFQKTFHEHAADRDLFVASLDYLPLDGWDLQGTAWIDYYTSNEQAKDAGLELTQLRAVAGRQLEDGSGVDITVHHVQFPDLERDEFTPPTLAEIADNRNDRIAVSTWHFAGEDKRVHGEVGFWSDQDDLGGDVEIGAEVNDGVRGNRAFAAFFGASAKFSSLVGGQLGYGKTTSAGRWDAFYEVGLHHEYGFPDNSDDIWQHRIGANWDLTVAREWFLSIRTSALWWDSDGSFTAGFYLQRMF